MQSLVSLRYPSDRVYDAVVSDRELKPGDIFELYGRTWRVIEPVQRHDRGVPRSARVVCVPV